MTTILPQQRLLLEQLIMSGRIAITDPRDDSILWRTVHECRTKGWLKLVRVNPDVSSIEITAFGRRTIERTPWTAPDLSGS